MATGKGLGKGLSALFGEEIDKADGTSKLKLLDIEPNPNQPRRVFDEQALSELAESIRKNGLITPIAVRKVGQRYQIIAGERRWRASRMANLTEVPAVVLDIDEQTAYELALIENLQREDLNPIEEAEGYKTLMEEYALTQDGVAEKVGKSRPAVANALRLLSLPEAVRKDVSEGRLSSGHARALLSIGDEALLVKAAEKVKQEGLSVRETERLAKKLAAGEIEKPEKPQDENRIYIEDLQRSLAAATGHKVHIQHGAKRGKLTIEYYGNDDLDAICQALRKLK